MRYLLHDASDEPIFAFFLSQEDFDSFRAMCRLVDLVCVVVDAYMSPYKELRMHRKSVASIFDHVVPECFLPIFWNIIFASNICM